VGVGQLPGSTHDTSAARVWNLLAALRDAGLIALGDTGHRSYDNTATIHAFQDREPAAG